MLTCLEADIAAQTQFRHALTKAAQGWPEDSDDERTLSRLCQRDWQANAYAGLARKTGVIESLPPGKAHGWIRADDGERVFFLQRDLPDSGTQEGARLNFALAPSWDRKREKLSIRAVDFRVTEE